MLIVKAIANPNIPLISAALFHSTPFLIMKKRVYWPQRSDSRGPPRNETSRNWRAEVKKFKILISPNILGHNPQIRRKKSSPGTISNRQALGLNATGPLTLNQVKIAYRHGAMKWHPDHHQGVDKVLGYALAEANFKKINAAYESLCNELSGP